MRGRVLNGGGDWVLLRRDGVLQLDVRIMLETEDKQHIYMSYGGYRHGPKDVIERLNKGETVDPSLYYFRATPYFETGSEKYARLNGICAAVEPTDFGFSLSASSGSRETIPSEPPSLACQDWRAVGAEREGIHLLG